MRTLISHSHHLEPHHFLFKFHLLSPNTQKPIIYFHKRCLLNTQQGTIFTSFSAASSTTSYNGWDDIKIKVDPRNDLGESNNNHLKKLLVSFGIDDKKYIFTCILGFVLALAVSRVRVSSIVVVPAAVIVFAVGFSFGFVNGKTQKGFGSNVVRKSGNDVSLSDHVDKLRRLEGLFDGCGVKVGELKSCIKKAIEIESVEVSDLEGYVDGVEFIDGLVLDARHVVQDCIESASSEATPRNLYQKNGRKRKEVVTNGFNLFGFMGSVFRGDASSSKLSSKGKVIRKDSITKDSASRGLGETYKSVTEGKESSWMSSKNARYEGNAQAMSDTNNAKGRVSDRDQEMERILGSRRMEAVEGYMSTRTLLDADGLNYNSTRFMKHQQVSVNMSSYRETRNWASNVDADAKKEFDVDERYLEDESFLKKQQVLRNSNGDYVSSSGREKAHNEGFVSSLEDKEMSVEDEHYSSGYKSKSEKGFDGGSSSKISDDLLFDKCLTEASHLLKQAKEYLKGTIDEIVAEKMLLESTRLLTRATTMKPMSLLAIGQLGNTYLVHGELKLRVSKELRSLLSRLDDYGLKRQSDLFIPVDETLPRKDRIAAHLVNICEDCETLLVEAGRKYRMALSIDGNDVRALYNWGLALFFRAQLLADVGPEAVLEADRLFLAAIDKFDAMLSRSNVCAPEALFRWGVALQQRSRLRHSNNRDKVKLLQQAKRLYEDALDMGKDNLQVKEALSSCITELKFNAM